MPSGKNKIRVRFAPSPTGYLHIGGIRTALYDYLFAKNQGGDFVLRIEDTDRNRLVEDSVAQIKESLKWLGLEYDEGPFFQSGRLEIYQKYARELIEKKFAYYCFCTPERLEVLRETQAANHQPPRYDRHCLKLTEEEISDKLKNNESYVIRFKMPRDETIAFDDIVYGQIEFDSNTLDDQIILKSDGFPTYHLAVVADDYEMKISHVIRGQEWISSTPKHILLYQAFGWPIPQFVHLPVIVGPDKSKLSKRHGAKGALDYRVEGYLPEAIVNFLALLGWAPGDDRELMTMSEMIKFFSLEKINKASPVFDQTKLDHFNSLYIRQLSIKDLADRILEFDPNLAEWAKDRQFFEKAVKTIQERMITLKDAKEMLEFYFLEPTVDPNLLVPKNSDLETTRRALEKSVEVLANLSDWNHDQIEQVLRRTADDLGKKPGQLLWPVRYTLTGKAQSPGAFEVLEALGKAGAIKRLNKVLAI